MKRLFFVALTTALLFTSAGIAIGLIISQKAAFDFWQSDDLLSPFNKITKNEPSLDEYNLNNAKKYPFNTSKITLGELVADEKDYREYLFTFRTMGKTMSGLATLPKPLQKSTNNYKVVVMIRGFVPSETYQPGIGTSPAARVFAQNGYITLAPDFFGFGKSDPPPVDTWEERFVKPISVIELIKSIQAFGPPLPEQTRSTDLKVQNNSIFIWAHSNGGQIALSVLEIMAEAIPTTLWAPVTAPFPYSILFYGDELADEGKEQRAWLALFEKKYNVLNFSPTQFLDQLKGPLQLHHGTSDEAALKTWSDEFKNKIDQINTLKQNSLADKANKIELNYYIYPGADHNLRPTENWNLAINRDLKFFAKYTK